MNAAVISKIADAIAFAEGYFVWDRVRAATTIPAIWSGT